MANAPHDTDGGSEKVVRQAPALTTSDKAIIAHLQENGRRPYVEIARALDVSERTVRNRVRKLLDAEIIQIAAVTNPAALGYDAAALIGLHTDPRHSPREIAEALARLDTVDYVVASTGTFSILVEVFCRDMKHLASIIETEIGRIPGITEIETFPYLSLYYQQPRFSGTHSLFTGRAGVRAAQLDDTDKAIVSDLSRDGRAPLQSVGERLGISESQVRARLNAMISSGSVQVLGIVNPMNLGYETISWVAIALSPGARATDVAESLTEMRAVSYIAITAGRYDIFAEVVCRYPDQLLRVLDDQIRPMAGVGSATAFLYLQLHYKRLLPASVET